MLLFLFACNNSGVIAASGEIDTAAPEEALEELEDDSAWDGAWMEVISPTSGAFLPLGEPASFEAIIYTADGEVSDFDEITWRSDLDDAFAPIGASFTDDSLDVGTHALTAEALLPNGDRLVYTMGGVLVQHEDAGTYVGNVVVDVSVTYNKTEYSAGCTGAVTLIVDVYGETAIGESTCTLSLLGYDQDTSYEFDLDLSEGSLSGDATVDLSIVTQSFDLDGYLSEGVLGGSWDDDIYGYVGVAGELEAERITRSVSGE